MLLSIVVASSIAFRGGQTIHELCQLGIRLKDDIGKAIKELEGLDRGEVVNFETPIPTLSQRVSTILSKVKS